MGACQATIGRRNLRVWQTGNGKPMRTAAALIAILAAISLYAQALVSTGLMAGAGPLAVVWRMAGYLTVLGNLATLILMVRVVVTGTISAQTAALITVVMAVVGLGYHILLAGIWQPQGLAWWADQGLHTAVPALVALWWACFAPKAGLVGRDVLGWLIWPIGYAAYALVRGMASGFYPYPFMDVATLGLVQVVVNVAGLAAAFLALGLLLIGCARIIR